MSERKVLFNQFLKDKRTYNLNVGYWRIRLQKAIEEKISKEDVLFKNKNIYGKNFYDGNPIFSYYSKSKNKAFRVIQEDATELESFKDIKLIEAWIDTIRIPISEGKENEVQELVISIFLTDQSVELCIILIKDWLSGQLDTSTLENILK